MTDASDGWLPLLGRVLLCVLFVLSGAKKLLGFGATVAYFAHDALPVPALAAIVAIVVELGGGLMLLAGLRTRVVAMILGFWCIATALVAHANLADPAMAIQFWKNVAMAGGFAFVVAHGAGRYALDARRPEVVRR